MADQSPFAPPKILFFAKNCCATYPPAKIITSLSIHCRIRGESSYSILAGARRDDLHSPRLPSALFGLIVTCLNDTSCNREHMACPASWYPADAPRRRSSAKHAGSASRSGCFVSCAISWLTCLAVISRDFDWLEIASGDDLAAGLIIAGKTHIWKQPAIAPVVRQKSVCSAFSTTSSSCPSLVPVMQSADFGDFDHRSQIRRLLGSRLGRVLREP